MLGTTTKINTTKEKFFKNLKKIVLRLFENFRKFLEVFHGL